MPRRYSRRSAKAAAQAVSTIVVFILLALYYGMESATFEMRRSLAVLLFGFIGMVFLLLVLLGRRRQKKRALAWQKAMTTWNQNVQAGNVYQHNSARRFLDDELEEFAAQVYKKMGYGVRHTGQSGDHGVDVLLKNPQQELEIVQCKQWRKPVGEREVRDLMGAMAHYKAVRGWIWAPGGFSAPARAWAQGKPVVLADDEEIGRLVQSAYHS